jgi:hypothetical protein
MDRFGHRQNILLVKDDVGRAKPPVVKLPPSGFVYGKPDYKQEAGAGVVTGDWKAHKQSEYPIKNTLDFRKINKMSAFQRPQRGATSSKVSDKTNLTQRLILCLG